MSKVSVYEPNVTRVRTVRVIPPSIQPLTGMPAFAVRPRRVAAYARVSTNSEEQLTSYEAQVKHYTEYIQSKEQSDNWKFVSVYTDRGITGTSTKKREGFNQMIHDALDGKIDLIITKSVSRFARNTVDTLTTIRKLKEYGVEVYFEEQNIYTMDGKGELLLTIMSSIAQEESRNISENVTWGLRKRFADGKVSMPYAQFMGYRRSEDGTPEIVEAEAKIIRTIFRRFLEGTTPAMIARELNFAGVPCPSRKSLLSENGIEAAKARKKTARWSASTIESILSNEKYKGDAILQKTYCTDYIRKTFVKNDGSEIPRYYAVNLLKCAAYRAYMARKHPAFLHLKHAKGEKMLKQRSSLLVHEISGVIFSSTDTLIISIFCGLSEASVYAVYSMVFNALRTIIGQAFNGTCYLLGNSYSQNSESYPTTHDKYNIIYTGGVFACFTVAYWMVLPFITLYTKGITDANYLDSKLPMLFCLIELLSACRVVDNQLIKNAYHARQTLNRSMIEAVINLVVSIVAVQYLGMYGVLLGTIAALLYRSNDVILYANHRILRRSSLKEYALYGANALVFAGGVILFSKITLPISNYLQWFGYAVVIGIAVFAVYALIDAAIFRHLTHSSH